MFSWNWLCFFYEKKVRFLGYGWYGFWGTVGTVGTVFVVRLVRYGWYSTGYSAGVRFARYAKLVVLS